jgi:hypothetical protein
MNDASYMLPTKPKRPGRAPRALLTAGLLLTAVVLAADGWVDSGHLGLLHREPLILQTAAAAGLATFMAGLVWLALSTRPRRRTPR